MQNLEFSDEEINEILENVFFVLGRTIRFIGHWYDQKRLISYKMYLKNI